MNRNQILKIGRRTSLPAPSAELQLTNSGCQRNRKWSSVDPPEGTIKYTASYADTLPCIAAQHETTTSEIMAINRLMTSMIFPGQVLYLPAKDYERFKNDPFSKCDTVEEASFVSNNFEDLVMVDSKVEKHEFEMDTLLDCKIVDITDKPIEGRIQVTAQQITFEPCIESTEVLRAKLIIPLKTIRNAVIKAQHFENNILMDSLKQRMELDARSRHRKINDRSTTAQEITSDSSVFKDTSCISPLYNSVLVLKCDPPVTRRHTFTFNTKTTKKTASEYCFEIPCDRVFDFQFIFKKWISNSEESSEISPCEKEKSAFTIYIFLKEGYDLLHKNSSGADDTYVKFKVEKKVVFKSHAVHKSRNPKWLEPLQLNIRSLSTVIKLTVMNCEPGRMDSYIGETTIVPEELSINIPTELKLNLMDKKNGTLDACLGYLVVQCTLTDLLCQTVFDGDDTDAKLPAMSENSYILETSHIMKLQNHLPSITEDRKWMLAYSSQKHGYSINTLFRRMSEVDSATLLVIQDSGSKVFGALLSCAPRLSDCFYGTGDSFLFTFDPFFKKFGWSGKNFHIIKGDEHGLAIGAGDGFYGIWLDGDLYHGHTEYCETFDNDPLTSTTDFIVRNIETWYFLKPFC